jgi:hypothetical protein
MASRRFGIQGYFDLLFVCKGDVHDCKVIMLIQL